MIRFLEKCILQGLSTTAVGAYFFSVNTNVQPPLVGFQIPLYLLTFSVGFVGSIISDAVHEAVDDELPTSQKASDMTALALGSVLSGFLFYGVLEMSSSAIARDYGYYQALATGAVGELGGAVSYYVAKNLI